MSEREDFLSKVQRAADNAFVGKPTEAEVICRFHQSLPGEIRLDLSDQRRVSVANTAALIRQFQLKPEVIGGNEAEIQAATIVSLMASSVAIVREGSGFVGSGVLIKPNLVITAGHVLGNELNSSQYGVVSGNTATGIGVKVKIVKKHPQFSDLGGTFKNDLAFLQLAEDLDPPAAVAVPTDFDGAQTAQIVGFGNSTDSKGGGMKRFANLAIWSLECDEDPPKFSDCAKALEMTAGDPLPKDNLRIDSGNRDSGAPLFLVDSEGKLVPRGKSAVTLGITSRYIRHPGEGSIYTRLDRHSSWIATLP